MMKTKRIFQLLSTVALFGPSLLPVAHVLADDDPTLAVEEVTEAANVESVLIEFVAAVEEPIVEDSTFIGPVIE